MFWIENFKFLFSVKKGNSSNVDNTQKPIIKSKGGGVTGSGNITVTGNGNTIQAGDITNNVANITNNIDYQKNYDLEGERLKTLFKEFNPTTASEAEFNTLFTKLNDVEREYNNLPPHLLKQNENFPKAWQCAIILLINWREKHNKDTTVLEGMKTRYQ